MYTRTFHFYTIHDSFITKLLNMFMYVPPRSGGQPIIKGSFAQNQLYISLYKTVH